MEPEMLHLIIFLAFFCLIYIIFFIFINRQWKKRAQEIKMKINALSNNALEITPEGFFDIKKNISSQNDFAGVYILYNKTKNMYYVGQSMNVFKRVNNHLTGHGNGDVYADFKYGDEFTIRMIALENSGHRTLNELERNTIMTYDACSKGYNKTRGNSG